MENLSKEPNLTGHDMHFSFVKKNVMISRSWLETRVEEYSQVRKIKPLKIIDILVAICNHF